jgi:hypothetical protein
MKKITLAELEHEIEILKFVLSKDDKSDMGKYVELLNTISSYELFRDKTAHNVIYNDKTLAGMEKEMASLLHIYEILKDTPDAKTLFRSVKKLEREILTVKLNTEVEVSTKGETDEK